MSFQFIPNLIIIASFLAILVLFLRRLPEVIDQKNQVSIMPALPGDELGKQALLKNVSTALKGAGTKTLKKVWTYMLEAKDLKQGKILASQFVRMVRPATKHINIGVHQTMQKAERLLQEGEYEQAENTFFEIIRKYPHEYHAYEGLVKIYIKQRNYKNLVEVLEYLIEHVPANDSYLAQMGNVLMSTHRYANAIPVYEKALGINNLIPTRFVNCGLCYQAIGNLQKARENFQHALDLEPTNVPYLMLLVDILLQLKENDKAVKALKTAAGFDPDNKVIAERLANLEQ